MPRDYAANQTDKELARLERKLLLIYSESKAQMDEKVDNYYNGWYEQVGSKVVYHEGFIERYAKEYQAFLDGKYHDSTGKYTDQEVFDRWVWAQEGRGKHIETLRDDLARAMTEVNMRASAMINDKTPGIYSMNANWEAYKIEVVRKDGGQWIKDHATQNLDKAGKLDVAFNLVNEQTIKELATDKNHVEFRVNSVNRKRDYDWNKSEITKALTAGILQGESPYDVAHRYMSVMHRNQTAAIRNARTSITSAQNAGAQNTYDKAVKMGIQIKKQWMSTRDSRTRKSHVWMNGQEAEVDKQFRNGLMYPGDTNGAPEEVYNCRCTMVTIDPAVKGVNADPYDVEGFKDWMKQNRPELFKNEPEYNKVPSKETKEPEKDDRIQKQIDKIMKSYTVKDLNETQKEDFKKYIENMEPDYRDIYERMTDFHKKNNYSVKNTGWYAPYERKITMDINSTGWERACGRTSSGAFKTKFHEELHQLDHILGNTTGHLRSDDATQVSAWLGDPGIYGPRLQKAIEDDIIKFINDGIDRRNATSPGKKVSNVSSLNRLTAQQKAAFWDYLSVTVEGKDFKETAKHKALISPFTDAVGLATSGKLNAYNNGYWGHKASYQKDRGISGATSECFAEIGAFLFTNDKEALDMCSKVMPGTVKEYKSVFKDIADFMKNNTIDYRY